jgi:hypothetical protein
MDPNGIYDLLHVSAVSVIFRAKNFVPFYFIKLVCTAKKRYNKYD